MKLRDKSLVLTSLSFVMLSFSAYADGYILKSSGKNGWDNRSHGTYSSYSECSKAAKRAKESNPDRNYWCMRN